MPTTQPGLDRARFGFAETVSVEFEFLVEHGLRRVKTSDLLVRYESKRRFVSVFHEPGDYEVGVSVGRWIVVRGVRVEEHFSLREVVALQCDPAEVGYSGTGASTPELVLRFVRQLALLTRDFAEPLLGNGDPLFDELSERSNIRAIAERTTWRASRLRARADEAWHRRDFGEVANIYLEMMNEEPVIELRSSERGRLKYARKQVGSA